MIIPAKSYKISNPCLICIMSTGKRHNPVSLQQTANKANKYTTFFSLVYLVLCNCVQFRNAHKMHICARRSARPTIEFTASVDNGCTPNNNAPYKLYNEIYIFYVFSDFFLVVKNC